jgi:tyrosine-protein phosphatase YwqE
LTWTDLHSHILPGFDDGASSDEEFLEMARVAVEGGTRLMAATPHYDCDSPSFEPRETVAVVEFYNGLLRENGVPLVLGPGQEVRINAGLLELAKEVDRLRELSLGGKGKYMLVDLPLSDMPLATPDILFHIQLCGITPILAHPERNRYLVEHPSVVSDLVERGIAIQVNSGSLEGIFGKQARRTARSLLEEGAARLVASDAHKPRGRTPDLSGAATALGSLLGEEAPRALLSTNPSLVLDGEELAAATEGYVRGPGSRRKRLRGRPR